MYWASAALQARIGSDQVHWASQRARKHLEKKNDMVKDDRNATKPFEFENIVWKWNEMVKDNRDVTMPDVFMTAW